MAVINTAGAGMKRLLCLLISVFISHWVYATPSKPLTQETVTVQLQHVAVVDVLHMLAKLAKINIILSDAIEGKTNINLTNVPWQQAFDSVLSSNSLALRRLGPVWMVSPQQQAIEAAKQAPLKLIFLPIHYANAKSLATLLKHNQRSLLSARGQVSVDSRTNTLIIEDTQSHLASIKRLIQRIDRPLRQVHIEARIVVVDDTALQELGIKLKTTGPSAPESVTGVSSAALHLGVANPAGALGLTVGKLAGGVLLDLELSALESEGEGKVISAPTLVITNKQTGYVEQGSEIPFNTSTSSGATQVEFKKAVLGLHATPQITPDHHIIIKVKVSKDFVTKDKGQAGNIPIIATSSLSTQVLVANDQTLVLGGILSEQERHDIKSIPWLSDIPLLGRLFQNKTDSHNKEELLVFITPSIE